MPETVTALSDFHFLRPVVLWLLPLSLGLFFLLKQQYQGNNAWQKVIDDHLLKHLLPEHSKGSSFKGLPLIGLVTFLVGTMALAGPSFIKQPMPVVKNQEALVVVLDLTLSMHAEDIKPSRLVAAKRKIEDLLRLRQDGLFGLVVFSGSAHTVVPLTDDKATLLNMLPALDPKIMPSLGNNVMSGIEQATGLFQSAGIPSGKILLITDELRPKQIQTIADYLPDSIKLSIIGVGTEEGAPIPYDGFLKDNKTGAIILAKLNWPELQKAARKAGFAATLRTASDQDIERLRLTDGSQGVEDKTKKDRQADLWIDSGHWLLILLIPCFLGFFRRGWLLIGLVMLLPDDTWALDWKDLWQTSNQQGQTLLEEGKSSEAAEAFDNPQWKSAAYYQNKDYEKALAGYQAIEDKSADTHYNLGNTYTQLGNYDKAIEAYDEALKQNPDLADAKANKALVEKLKEQQEQQQQNQQGGDNNQDQQHDQKQQNDNQQASDDQQESQQGNSSESEEQDSQSGQQSQDSAEQQQQQQQQQQQEADSTDEKTPSTDSSKAQEDNRSETEQSQAASSDEKDNGEEHTEQSQVAEQPSPENIQKQEETRALKQFLNQLPDDPGGLLRRKFEAQYRENRRNNTVIDKESDQVW